MKLVRTFGLILFIAAIAAVVIGVTAVFRTAKTESGPLSFEHWPDVPRKNAA